MSDDARSTSRLGVISGLITLGGVMVWAAALGVLATDRRAYSSLVRLSGNVGVRLALCAVVFAATLHTVDGVRRVLQRARPDRPRSVDRWQAAAWFSAFAVGVPAAALLLWPFVEGRIA